MQDDVAGEEGGLDVDAGALEVEDVGSDGDLEAHVLVPVALAVVGAGGGCLGVDVVVVSEVVEGRMELGDERVFCRKDLGVAGGAEGLYAGYLERHGDGEQEQERW